MVVSAEEKYGDFFKNAAQANILLMNFVKEIKSSNHYIFAAFLSSLVKYHTLALFSAVRLHRVQTKSNLRYCLESLTDAAYALQNPIQEDFLVENNGLLEMPENLRKKRYNWIEKKYKTKSDQTKAIKKDISEWFSHSSLLFATNHLNMENPHKFGFNFFDSSDDKDDKFVKIDLWQITDIATGAMGLIFEVNQNCEIITFSEGFIERLNSITLKNLKLKSTLEVD
jgi:hypothetical protein